LSHGLAITPLDAAAILTVLAAALGYVNHCFLRGDRAGRDDCKAD